MAYQPFFINEYQYQPYNILEFLMTPYERFRRLNLLREPYRPRIWSIEQNYNQLDATLRRTKNQFQINLDVQHFAPEDITVKVTDGWVTINAKHDEKQDEHGYVSRHFTRRYSLPENWNPDLVESKLSSDGVLTITAQRSSPDSKYERAIPITQTGPIRKEIRDDIPQIVTNDTEK